MLFSKIKNKFLDFHTAANDLGPVRLKVLKIFY